MTAVLRAPPSTSTRRDVPTDGVFLPRPAAVGTSSAIEGTRRLPADALLDALGEALESSMESPEQQRVPNETTCAEAIYLLSVLPGNLKSPEPVIEPSGTIAWVWDNGPEEFLALAVNGNGRLQHSAIIDNVEKWGSSALTRVLSEVELDLLAHFRTTLDA